MALADKGSRSSTTAVTVVPAAAAPNKFASALEKPNGNSPVVEPNVVAKTQAPVPEQQLKPQPEAKNSSDLPIARRASLHRFLEKRKDRLLGLPLRHRRKYLKDLFGDERLGYFEYAKEITIEKDDACLNCESTLIKVNSFLGDAFQSSCEGIMVKSLDVDAGYSPSKRSDTWLKVKRDYLEGLNDSLDLVPIGAWHGNGRKAGWFSPFLMACYNPDTEEFQSVCRVMSGFSDAFYIEMKEFFSGDKILSQKPAYYRTAEVPDMWFLPEVVWEIRGADLTVSPVHQAAVGLVHPSRGISIRFPRFIRLVRDRNPEECSTANDIAEMFNSQTRKMDVASGD